MNLKELLKQNEGNSKNGMNHCLNIPRYSQRFESGEWPADTLCKRAPIIGAIGFADSPVFE